ncbi:retrovirus-related pol polyprotein from transposon TNT 1-94 [Tanacetum coccineum]|uniref:Retrovirus-related pol polyprotein from transposon TNT 1-94 n=1 Tax=Tanacetum coccineum TaxID=301880 RepID=A0ABQ4XI12_9ASTR
MFDDLEYAQSLKKEADELESEKSDFSNEFDLLLQECVSKDIMCSFLYSLADIDEQIELQCLYLEKIKECKSLRIELSKQTGYVSKAVYTGLLKSFAKLEKHSISLELALQLCQEKIKNDKLKKLIETLKGKSMDTKFEKPYVVRQPNAFRFPKPLVLGKPAPFSDSLERKCFSKTKTSNAKAVCATCGKCVFKSDHGACVSKFLNDVNARSKKPQVVPIKPRKPIRKANQYVATPPMKTVASDSTIRKTMSYYRMLYEKMSRAWTWWIEKQCLSDLEVAFRKSTCFVRDLWGNDLLTGNRRSDLYTISLQETSSPTPACFMEKASPTQAWLWHRRIFHLNFDTINLLLKKDIVNGLPKLKYVKDQLCSSCELGKAKKSFFKTKIVPCFKGRLHLLHMDL